MYQRQHWSPCHRSETRIALLDLGRTVRLGIGGTSVEAGMQTQQMTDLNFVSFI